MQAGIFFLGRAEARPFARNRVPFRGRRSAGAARTGVGADETIRDRSGQAETLLPRRCAARHSHAENVARPAGDRPTADLVGHLARAGRSALLLVPELRFNHGSPDPGRLVVDGALRLLVEEVLARVGDACGGLSTARLVRTVLISHSGGFHAAAALATRGGLPVDELCLLDSLYGEEDAFFAFADAVLAEPGQRSLTNLYGSSTERRSLALLAHARAAATARGLDAAVVAGSDTPVGVEQLWPGAPGAAFLSQRVSIAHSAMPAALVGRLLAASRLPGPGVA